MSLSIIESKDYISMPWKNGRGVSREILRMDHEGTMALRISTAPVTESSTFSDYKNYHRILINLGQASMWLAHNGQDEFELKENIVYAFDGGLPTNCRIMESTMDFNIMAHNQWLQAHAQFCTLASAQSIRHIWDGIVLIYSVNCDLMVQDERSILQKVSPGSSAYSSASISNELGSFEIMNANSVAAQYILVLAKKLVNS